MKSILGNLIALIIGLILAFLIGEALTRTVLPISTLRSEYNQFVGLVLRVPNQIAQYIGQDYSTTVFINSAGFHDFEHTIKKPDDTYRIAVIGDSFIEGLQVGRDKNLTHLLENKLNNNVQNGKKFEVLNFGVSGFGIAQYYRVMDVISTRYKPDIIIMAVYVDNDFYNSIFELEGDIYKPYYRITKSGSMDYIPSRPYANLWLKELLKKSTLFLFVKQAIDLSPSIQTLFARTGLITASPIAEDDDIPKGFSVYDSKEPPPWDDAYKTGLKIIKEASLIAGDNDVKFVIMIIPPMFMANNKTLDLLQKYPHLKEKNLDFNYPMGKIAEFTAKEHINMFDLSPLFEDDYKAYQTSFSWLHDGHWNEYGHQKVADFVFNYLSSLLIFR